jgi:hypothetical protein
MRSLFIHFALGSLRRNPMRNSHENGMALITALVVLLLVSTMIAGLAWLVMSDQKLGGNNSDRQLAFYGAEAGMEMLTANLENAFDANYAVTAAAINGSGGITSIFPSITGVQYLAPGSTVNGSGYTVTFVPAANGNPSASYGTVPTGPYAGMVALMTPYTLSVTAHTTYGSEVKLQREVQTVAIPLFQFGMFSQTDLSFFAGPNFNFGGRVHTNGNLWLAEGTGDTLTLADKTTAAGEIITSNLENDQATTAVNGYDGAVDITTGSSTANLLTQSATQSVQGTTNWYGAVGAPNEPAFANVASGVYNNNVGVKETGVTALNLSIATPSIGGQPIDLIRRPVAGENSSNPAKLAEQYYSQVSLRILLSDYGSGGTCATSDISSTSATALPLLAPNGSGSTQTPVDLAGLAWSTNTSQVPAAHGSWPSGTLPYAAAPAGFTAANLGVTIFPLPMSYATSSSYSATNGYWQTAYYPVISGCLKIDMQNNSGTWQDVTWDILNYGFTGRNINPLIGKNGVPAYSSYTPPNLAPMPIAQVNTSGPVANGAATVGCTDPSTQAIIRLARLRDNPSTAASTNNYCGNNPSNDAWSGSGHNYTTENYPSQMGTDYWPNVLYDTREGLLRDVVMPTDSDLPLAGAMYYVELDVANLDSWFVNDATGKSALNTTGYSVYFSDRRGNQPDPTPPASVSSASALTGGFGYEDHLNPSVTAGCPDSTLEPAEDFESDYVNGVSQQPTYLRTYGNILSPTLPTKLWPVPVSGVATASQLGSVSSLVTAVLSPNPSCASPTNNWPYAIAKNGAGDLRENPPIFYRRALKIIDASTISIGSATACNGVPCGLTIASENPAYIYGDYNNPGLNTSFTGASVGSSVIADAVTLLSDSWNDVNSFAFSSSGISTGVGRNATQTTYRLAVAAGKGIPFQYPASYAPAEDFGTDGGAHNFLRYLEDWGGQTLYYKGSIVSIFFNHQATGVYKCCNTVYSPPTRGYNFDTNFLTPSLLPPLTPMLRDINTIGFTQIILPTQ